MTDLPAGTQAWQSSELTANYLNTTRAALPLASEQLDVMLYVIGRATSTVTSILDLGAGSGTLSHVLLARYPDAHTTLVDYSDPMLDSAKQNFAPEQAAIIKANTEASRRKVLDELRANATVRTIFDDAS